MALQIEQFMCRSDNFGVLDFTLSQDDLEAFEALDSKDGRMGPDPATMNS